jgi:hypothetical protein
MSFGKVGGGGATYLAWKDITLGMKATITGKPILDENGPVDKETHKPKTVVRLPMNYEGGDVLWTPGVFARNFIVSCLGNEYFASEEGENWTYPVSGHFEEQICQTDTWRGLATVFVPDGFKWTMGEVKSTELPPKGTPKAGGAEPSSGTTSPAGPKARATGNAVVGWDCKFPGCGGPNGRPFHAATEADMKTHMGTHI